MTSWQSLQISAGAEDGWVIERALSEQRVLLTEDKDFGQLVFASRRPAAGIVFIRFPANARAGLSGEVRAFVQNNEAAIAGSFATLQPGRARISRLPA
jgi:predicted nuclease of predicted toxin-antitoxin system